jgi:Pathogenicity locus
MNNKSVILKQFQTLSGVGPAIAHDLWNLGFRSLDELKKTNPELLYERLCILQGTHVDRCMLYVFRCIQYQLSTDKHDKKLLLWWNWKD